MVTEVLTTDSALDSYRRLMRALHAEHARRGDDPWNTCPMTLPQLRALSLIGASQRGLSSRELAATLRVGASAVTPLVDRLVERGFARRDEDPADRRIARLHTTPRGASLLEDMLAGKDDVMRDALARLTPDQLETVRAAFDVLRVAVKPEILDQPAISAHKGIPA